MVKLLSLLAVTMNPLLVGISVIWHTVFWHTVIWHTVIWHTIIWYTVIWQSVITDSVLKAKIYFFDCLVRLRIILDSERYDCSLLL